MGKITRALISVSHKEGMLDLAKGLSKLGIEILSTGGTAKLLRDGGVAEGGQGQGGQEGLRAMGHEGTPGKVRPQLSTRMRIVSV